MPQPLCPDDSYQLMLACWRADRESRPTFAKIHCGKNFPNPVLGYALEDPLGYEKDTTKNIYDSLFVINNNTLLFVSACAG